MSLLLVSASVVSGEAGPGNEVTGQEVELDEAYKAHVASLMSAISVSEGKSDVKYTDLNPQQVDIHTIAPRVAALKVGMNALGHRMFHVHSDEQENWSAEIMSSGLSAGFTFTDREKGLQKGDNREGSQWTIYSTGKSFRVKDEATGDLLQLQDGLLTVQGTKGENSKKPRITVIGANDSVPRVTLVSKEGGSSKHISMYNRYGKFGVFSGASDKSIFHVSADGSELALTSNNVQPHLLIESAAKSETSQEVILKGHDAGLKMYHKSKTVGFCNLATDSADCATFFQSTTDGSNTDFISATDSAVLKVSHKIRGGNSEIQLVSQDKIGHLTSTDIYNQEGELKIRSKVKSASRELLTVKPTGETHVHGKLEVGMDAHFKGEVKFAHNVDVTGVVTMAGGSVNSLFEDTKAMKSESQMLRKRMEDMDDDAREMRNRMVEMQSQNTMLKEQMERLMSTMAMMQQTLTRAA